MLECGIGVEPASLREFSRKIRSLLAVGAVLNSVLLCSHSSVFCSAESVFQNADFCESMWSSSRGPDAAVGIVASG